MKSIAFMLGLIFMSGNAIAQAAPATLKDAYLRCTAVTHIISLSHSKPELKEQYKADAELFNKYAAWFYPNSLEELTAALGKFMQSVHADLESKKMSTEAFAELADACAHILMDTTVKFSLCVGNDVSDAKRRSCAQQVVGLKPNYNFK